MRRKLLQAVLTSLWLIAAAAVIVAAIEAMVYIPFYGAARAGFAVNPTDFITIILAATAVILTALAIILAVAGVLGYTQIKDQAMTTAKVTAEKAATDRVDQVLVAQVLQALKRLRSMPGELESDAIAKAQFDEQDGEG